LIWTVIKTDNPKTAKIRRNPPKSRINENKPKKKLRTATRGQFEKKSISLAVTLKTTFNTYDICGTFWILHPWNISWKMEGIIGV